MSCYNQVKIKVPKGRRLKHLIKLFSEDAELKGYILNSSQIGRIDGGRGIDIPAAWKDKNETGATAKGGWLLSHARGGSSFSAPEIGDYRISFEVIGDTAVSVIAKQIGKTFTPFPTPTGDVDELRSGTFTSDQMFKKAVEDRALLTWVLRLSALL